MKDLFATEKNTKFIICWRLLPDICIFFNSSYAHCCGFFFLLPEVCMSLAGARLLSGFLIAQEDVKF